MAKNNFNLTLFPQTQIVAKTAAAGVVAKDVVRVSTVGDGTLVGVDKALAAVVANVDGPLGVLVEETDGGTAPGNGATVHVLLAGLVKAVANPNPDPVVGATVYVSDTGTLSTVAGTVPRPVGEVLAFVPGVSFDCFFNGLTAAGGGAGGVPAPSDAPYLTDSASAGLTNEKNIQALAAALGFLRTDGAGNSELSAVQVGNFPAGVAAAGLSTALDFVLKDSAGNRDVFAQVAGEATDVTDASEDADVVFSTRAAGTLAKRVRLRKGGLDLLDAVNWTVAKTANGDLTLGAGATGDLVFRAGGADRWKIDGLTGALTTPAATTPIKNVANPVDPSDADNLTSRLADTATKVPLTRILTAGVGMSGGGDLTVDRTFDVDYGVTVGTAAQGNDDRIAEYVTVTTSDGVGQTRQLWAKTLVVGRFYDVEAAVVGQRTDVSGYAGGYRRVARARLVAGVATLTGGPYAPVPDDEAAAGYDADITVAGADIQVLVTGIATQTVNWAAHVRVLVVT